ncbi:DUF4303 domain-containing protein [Tahibacter sp.]|uniref:DUF4303 domain-containing protein n=1 Tax=Tahibacter sp. TaxID=2056211 RepID=UPI0028C4777D|nr:DUF4303 domain-containing protein [Tahibacter sp.]
MLHRSTLMLRADMNLDDLTERAIAAARTSFSDLMEKKKGEAFYAFILYTDADCYTVLPSANSIEKYREKIAKRGVDDPKRMAGYKWSIGEWAYESWKAEAFDAICEDLSEASQSACEAGTFPGFRQQVHSSMIEALASLDAEGFFGSMRSGIVIFVSSSDYDESIELENRSAQRLNSPEVYAEFLKRYVA